MTTSSLFAQIDFTLMTWPEVKQAPADGKDGPHPERRDRATRTSGRERRSYADRSKARDRDRPKTRQCHRCSGDSLFPEPRQPAQLNEEAAEQMIANGFKNIVLLGDHGGDQGWVRKDLIATAVGVNNGIEGDARRSTPEIGKRVSDMKVDDAINQIRRLLK